MKTIMKRLMIYTMVLLGAALFVSTNASAIIAGTPPAAAGSTIIITPSVPSGIVPPALG